jgi:hypothetical protein
MRPDPFAGTRSSLRKLRMGEICWSPQYQRNSQQLEVWNLLLKKAKGGTDNSRFLIRKARTAGLEEHLTEEIPVIEDARARIYREHKRLRKTATRLRISWLQSLGEAKAATGYSTMY